MLALALHLAPDVSGRLFDEGRMFLAVDNSGAFGGLVSAFKELTDAKRATIVVLDDAAYSGEQLASFIEQVRRQWRLAMGGRSRPTHLAVGIPFVAEPALRLLQRGADAVHTCVRVRSLFQRRSIDSVLAADVFFARRGGLMFTEYRSLFFDVLGLRPTNTLLVFEHKIADGLSIPHRWLQTGPGVPPDVHSMYRVRPTHVARLAAMLKRDVSDQRTSDLAHGNLDHIAANEPMHRDVCRRVIELMHTPGFRTEFMVRVTLSPGQQEQNEQQYTPLLPPEFCSPRYRQYVREHAQNLGGDAYAYMPYCRRSPYKRASFRTRISLPV